MNKKKIVLSITIFIIPIVIVFIVAVVAILIFIGQTHLKHNDETSYLKKQNQSSTESIDKYIGFQNYNDTYEIKDNRDLSSTITDFYTHFVDLEQYEHEMQVAADEQDTEAFFESYRAYNETASTLMWKSQAISDYFYKNNSAHSKQIQIFGVKPAYAKERFSYWYFVPIIGSLIKAKHQSIETARSGIYNYVKNEIPIDERQSILKEYGFNNIEDIASASDHNIEKMARDPILKAGINWAQISTDLGKQAVFATVDTYKIGPSRTPGTTVAVNSALRIISARGSSVSDSVMKDSRALTAISGSIAQSIDSVLGEDVGKEWTSISHEKQEKILNDIHKISQTRDVALIGNSLLNTPYETQLSSDTWYLLAGNGSTAPVALTINLPAKSLATIGLIVENIDDFTIDPEVARNLGIDCSIQIDNEFIALCIDPEKNTNNYEINNCREDYNSCKKNPYKVEAGYSTCISAGGGCADIGRWSYVNEQNCPIDANLNLDESSDKFNPDHGNVFADGNLKYCQCIVDCRNQYWERIDCTKSLRECCEKLD